MTADEQPDATPDNFAKIYGTILDSSIWEEPHHTVRVWITMLVMADPQGVVRASYSGLRRRSGVTMEELAEALEVLESPDDDSRNPEHEGRRITKIKGGWFIYNAKEYRDLRTKDQVAAAERAKRFRDKRKGNVTGVTDNVTNNARHTEVRPEVEVEEEVEEELPSLPTRATIESQEWDDDGVITRFCRMQDNPESWQHLLAGYQNGMGTEGGKAATQKQIAQACLEAETLSGDMSPRRFRRVLAQVMENPADGGPTKLTGNTLRAGEIINEVKKCRNPQFPTNATPEWRDKLNQAEVRAVNAIGVGRILGEDKPGIVLAQLAKMLGEAQ